MENDRALQALSMLEAVPSAVELLERVVDELDKRVDQKIYSTLNTTLLGDHAVQLVTEKAAYEKIRSVLRNIEKRGRAASETLKPMLEGKING